jgi:hypothetical protein
MLYVISATSYDGAVNIIGNRGRSGYGQPFRTEGTAQAVADDMITSGISESADVYIIETLDTT